MGTKERTTSKVYYKGKSKMNDNIAKLSIVSQIYNIGKEEAKTIIDQAKIDDGDDVSYIAELERLYAEK